MTSITNVLGDPSRSTAGRAGFRSSFHLVLALLMAGSVAYGFSRTVEENLFHPSIPRPLLLYVHAAVFGAWICLYVLQTALIRAGEVKLHRRTGLAGLCIGAAIPFLGVSTAIVMRRFDIIHFHRSLSFIAVPLWDMVAFTPLFILGALWRKRPEFHRRLMFLATCMVIDAGLGRFPVPDAWFSAGWFYFVIDALVLIAIARDLLRQHRVHPVFAIGLPLIMVGQVVTWTFWQYHPAFWIRFCRALVGVG
jgi:hypothetical protein